MKIKRRWIFLFLFIFLLTLPFLASADVGGNVDYDTPSGGDWGGDDWGGDDWGGSGFGFDPFTMFYFGSRMGLSPIMMIGIVVVFILLKSRYGRSTDTRSNNPPPQKRTVHAQKPFAPTAPRIQEDPASLDALRESDPNFSQNAFLSRVSNMFMQLQEAWTDKDWKRVRPFEHDQIFHMHNEQLNRFIENGQTNVIEDIAILDTRLESYEQDGPYEYLNVIIRARFKDYIIDDASGQMIKGFKDRPVTMTYRWKIMRRRGTKTEHSDTMVTQCPNCGANMSIGQNGICEYCGSEVTLGTHDWVLTQIVPLAQEN